MSSNFVVLAIIVVAGFIICTGIFFLLWSSQYATSVTEQSSEFIENLSSPSLPTSIPMPTSTATPAPKFALDKFELHQLLIQGGWQMLDEGIYVADPLFAPDSMVVEAKGDKIISVIQMFSESGTYLAVATAKTLMPNCPEAEKFITKNAYKSFHSILQPQMITCQGYSLTIMPNDIVDVPVTVLRLELR